MNWEWVILGAAAYLLGSIPFAVLISKGYHGIDIREHGSKNAGATNVFRVLGKKTGLLTLVLDILKGYTAANLAYLAESESIHENLLNAKVAFGLLAVLGHLYPVFAGFRGGKGIATLLGMVFALHYLLALSCIAVFIIVLMAAHMVSLASITAALSFSLFVYLIFGLDQPVLMIFGFAAALLVLYTHRSNVQRLWNGTESKMHFRKSEKAH